VKFLCPPFPCPHCRGRDTGCPVPPSQIPAGDFLAPGSSDQLALACARRNKLRRCCGTIRWQKLSSVWQGIPLVGCLLGYGPQEGWPVLFRLSYGTGCLCGLRCSVGPFSSVGPDGSGLPLDTMSQSDSRMVRRRFFSLRLPSCLVLVVSTAGTFRASFVRCVSFNTRHALRPRQALSNLTGHGPFGFGFSTKDCFPACV